MKRQAGKLGKLDKALQDHKVYSKKIYTKDPRTLQSKKSLSNASIRIKKVKQTLIDIFKVQAELEKILSDAAS